MDVAPGGMLGTCHKAGFKVEEQVDAPNGRIFDSIKDVQVWVGRQVETWIGREGINCNWVQALWAMDVASVDVSCGRVMGTRNG